MLLLAELARIANATPFKVT